MRIHLIIFVKIYGGGEEVQPPLAHPLTPSAIIKLKVPNPKPLKQIKK